MLVKGGTVSEESKASTGSQVWEEVFLSPQEGEAGLPHGAGPWSKHSSHLSGVSDSEEAP